MAAAIARSRGRVESDPNVIPLIDVLLVLLIIYMLLLRIRYVIPVQVPPPVAQSPAPAPTQIVLELLPQSGFALNGQPVADEQLEATLAQIYAPRPTKLLFIQSAPDRAYHEVVAAMDRSRSAGIEVIALMPRGRTTAHR